MTPPLSYAGATDVGRVRDQNEDAWIGRPEIGLFAVADGMGGHAAGEVASRLAIDTLDESLDLEPAGTVERAGSALDRAVRSAGLRIQRRARESAACRGMGTTLTALLLLDGGDALLAHVGDSRAYRVRSGRLERLTHDHTWVQEEVDRGAMTSEEARTHPAASVLTRALGTENGAQPDLLDPGWRPGDLFLLCSDGLTAALDDADLEEILSGADALDATADRLVREANDRGGPDNVTVVLVRPEPAAV